MKDKHTLIMFRYKVEEKEEWLKCISEIPFIKFDPKWSIKIIPPFGGAIARFKVKFKNKEVSIYLDCYDILGYFGSPYWEIFPYKDGVGRCEMNDTALLLSMIKESLESDE